MTGRLKLAEKPSTVTTDQFPQPQVNMVNLNWPGQEKGKRVAEVGPKINKRVTKEANRKSKATISARVVLCSRCKCESELEITLDEQRQSTTSVFDIIGTSYHQNSVPAPSRDRARQKNHERPTQRIIKVTK
ncbi:unnamed protein product [Prunus brigantina]